MERNSKNLVHVSLTAYGFSINGDANFVCPVLLWYKGNVKDAIFVRGLCAGDRVMWTWKVIGSMSQLLVSVLNQRNWGDVNIIWDLKGWRITFYSDIYITRESSGINLKTARLTNNSLR